MTCLSNNGTTEQHGSSIKGTVGNGISNAL